MGAKIKLLGLLLVVAGGAAIYFDMLDLMYAAIAIVLGLLMLFIGRKAKIRKIGRDEIISCKGKNKVILSDFTKKHILEHARPGKGSVFGNVSLSDVRKAVSKISSANFRKEGGPGLVTLNIKNAGYNLVETSAEIEKKYGVIKKVEVTKLERNDKIKVPAYIVNNSLNQFQTNLFTVIIRPSNPDYLPEPLKKDTGVQQDIQSGKSFSVLTAFPGDPNVPVTSEWKNSGHAIIIPDSGANADIS